MTLNISRFEHAHDPQPNPTVAHVQARLIGKGYSVGVYGPDGHYGPASEAAVRRFQTHLGLDVDGIVGPDTLRHLDAVVGVSSAVAFADRCYRLVTTGYDGTPPAYVYGAKATNLTDPSPDRLDCSGLVCWGVYQAARTVWVDGTWAQAYGCRLISTTQAMNTKGALLFASSNGGPSGAYHVAVSMGNGWTAEARSTARGCGSWSAAGRFTFGGLCPVLRY